MKIASLINNDTNCGTNNVHFMISRNRADWEIITLHKSKEFNSLGFRKINLCTYFRVIFLFFKKINKFDVVLVDGLINFYLVYFLSAFIPSTKFYLLVHNDYSTINTRSKNSCLPNVFFTKLYDFVLTKSNIISCSKYTHDCLVKRGISSKYINNGIDLVEVDEDSSSVNNIWYVGRLIPLKKVDLLIQAASSLSGDYKLNIVGEGPELNNLKELAEELNFKVNFMGFKNMPFDGFLPGDIFVLPSEMEGRSISLMEAIVRYGYIISSDIEPNSDFCKQGIQTFKTNSLSDLTTKLSIAVELSPRERFDLIKKNNNNIRLLSSDVMTKSYIEYFKYG